MGPLDRLGALLDGMGCTVCDEHVPGARIRLLARRDDLLFLQLDCPACGSTSLGFVADDGIRPEVGRPDVLRPDVLRPDVVRPGGSVAAEAARLADAAPVSSDDVLDMHTFLDSWTGDLAGLVRPAGRPRSAPHRSGRSA